MSEFQGPAGLAAGQTPERAQDSVDEPVRWLPYGLGMVLQTCLWFLLFLGIVVAVLVGSRLTEFRYVGF